MAETKGYMRFFPYGEPYANQREAMDRIHAALDEERDVLFEGACGTGKTLSALVPALEHAREEDRTVVITTSVHQQMRQFVAEARAITETEPIRAVVFRGKGSMCHIDVGYEECQVLRDATRSLVDAEQNREELEQRQEELLAESQSGDADAADARSAIMEELDSVEAEIEEFDDASICERYHQNLTGDTDEFYGWLYDDVRTPDEIYEYAERMGFCGYELLKDGMENVDLVVCNYNHLLDPFVREQFFRWLDCEPSEVITVFDEAHNVEDAARDHAGRSLAEPTLDAAVDELEGCEKAGADRARNVISAFRDALAATYDDAIERGELREIDGTWQDVPIANEQRRDDLTLAFLDAYEGRGIDDDLDAASRVGQALDEEYEEAYRNGETTTRTECQTLQAARFVREFLDEGTELGQYPVVSVRRNEGTEKVYGRAELYNCIPRAVTEDLFDEVAASVLMSATLRPFDVVEDVLGLDDPETMAYGLTFPEERRRTFAVDAPPLFASDRDDPAVQEVVADSLRDIVRMTPGNTLAFFPSYAEAERYHDLLAGTDASRYLDEPGTSAEELRESFVADDDGVLFTSLWGTLAEGVSFDGDDAHAVAVVGVPYPHLDERMQAVQDAYDAVYDDRDDPGWEFAVEIPTIRKTRQALGRVLRSPEEFGVRALIDRRYLGSARSEMGRYSVSGTFPPEERAEMIDVAPEKLKFAMLNFYGDMDAYDGEPPTP